MNINSDDEILIFPPMDSLYKRNAHPVMAVSTRRNFHLALLPLASGTGRQHLHRILTLILLFMEPLTRN